MWKGGAETKPPQTAVGGSRILIGSLHYIIKWLFVDPFISKAGQTQRSHGPTHQKCLSQAKALSILAAEHTGRVAYTAVFAYSNRLKQYSLELEL